jgi:SPP1 family predicted phage head-tail adaptor
MSIYSTMRGAATSLIAKFKNDVQVIHQRQTRTADGAGGVAVVWTTVGTYDAAVMPVTGSESVDLDRANVSATHAIYLKYADGVLIEAGDRISFDDRIFNVAWRENIGEANAAYKIMCDEGVGS